MRRSSTGVECCGAPRSPYRHAGWLRRVLGVTGEEEGSQCSVTVTAPRPPGNAVWERPTGCPAEGKGPGAFVSQVTFLPEVKAAQAGWLRRVAGQAVGARLPLGIGRSAGRGWAVEEACEPPLLQSGPQGSPWPSPGAPCWSVDPAPSWVLSAVAGPGQGGLLVLSHPRAAHQLCLREHLLLLVLSAPPRGSGLDARAVARTAGVGGRPGASTHPGSRGRFGP